MSGAKGEVMSDEIRQVCVVNCGLPAHECACYRGLSVALDLPQNHAARIQDLEARLQAMTQQHEAALEAVGKAREAALREAAKP